MITNTDGIPDTVFTSCCFFAPLGQESLTFKVIRVWVSVNDPILCFVVFYRFH